MCTVSSTGDLNYIPITFFDINDEEYLVSM